jgi:hypothetical protein
MLENWMKWSDADGFTLLHPRGAAAGEICVRRRARPVRSAEEVVAEMVRGFAGIGSDVSAGPVEDVITDEGEHAALFTLCGRVDGAPRQVTVGVIYCDDERVLKVIGLARDARVFDEVARETRTLVETLELGLGELRRRAPRVAAPEGWTRVRLDDTEIFCAEDKPRVRIVLHLARPLSARARTGARLNLALDAVLPLIERGSTPAARVANRHGLVGERYRTRVDGRVVDTVLLMDERFAYQLRFERPADATDLEQDEAAFTRFVHELAPIPRPARAVAGGAVGHWVD